MDLTASFNTAAGGPSDESAGENRSPQDPMGPGPASAEGERTAAQTSDSNNAENQTAARSHLSVADAEAELETLEAGRATPDPHPTLKPTTKLRQIVDAEVERKREARISALKAYLGLRRSEAEPQNEHEQDNEPEVTF